MIDDLKRIEKEHMLELLKDRDGWTQGGVRVVRLFRKLGKWTIWIHKVLDFGRIRGQWHPHPWAMAVHVLSGNYYQEFGYSVNFKEPAVSARLLLPENTYYEITDKDMWHYVTPVDEFCYTTMVTAPDWSGEVLKTGLEKQDDDKPLHTVTDDEKTELLDWFTLYYENRT